MHHTTWDLILHHLRCWHLSLVLSSTQSNSQRCYRVPRFGLTRWHKDETNKPSVLQGLTPEPHTQQPAPKQAVTPFRRAHLTPGLRGQCQVVKNPSFGAQPIECMFMTSILPSSRYPQTTHCPAGLKQVWTPSSFSTKRHLLHLWIHWQPNTEVTNKHTMFRHYAEYIKWINRLNLLKPLK